MIIIAITIVFGGVFYVMQTLNIKSQNETASWKTYTNIEGKFSLEYPAHWKLSNSSDNNGAMTIIMFTGSEGSVQVSFGEGFGGMCGDGYGKIQIGGEELPVCHFINSDDSENWGQINKEHYNFTIGIDATANKPHLSNRVTILKILSTFKFTK